MIRSNYIEAINKHTLLPKWVMIIMENDLIKATNHYKSGATLALGPQLDWLANEIHRLTSSQKERLPTKSRKFKYPQILWIPAIYHDDLRDNEYREKFNDSLNAVVSMHREMKVLKLHTWDPMDRPCVTKKKMNAHGLSKYWDALSDAFQAWDKEQMRTAHALTYSKKIPQRTQQEPYKERNNRYNDRFHWRAPKQEEASPRRMLPEPPY